MIEDNIRSIMKSLFSGSHSPSLLLGAGYSYGAQNKIGNELPIGRKLANDLYDYFFVSKKVGDKLPIDLQKEINDKKDDLKQVCSFLKQLGYTDERNAFLTECFSGCRFDENAPQRNITNYSWSYIFSLNIDDLVENIYLDANAQLAVWDFSNPYQEAGPNVTNLIKLHGSSRKPQDGYVFDSDEYISFSIQQNSLLREFARIAVENDLILIGTEFQEDDLQLIMRIYEASGYTENQKRRIYITPKINNTSLKLKITQSKNDIWVPCKADEFFAELKEQIVIPKGVKDTLSERGVVFLSDLSQQERPSLDLYKGASWRYSDFFHDVDIKHKDSDKWLLDVKRGGNRQIVSFYGLDYIGKSCCAQHLFVELFKEGYVCIYLRFLTGELQQLLQHYFESISVEPGTALNVALHIDQAGAAYKSIAELSNSCPSSISKLVIITEDTVDNHQSKKHHIVKEPGFSEHEIRSYMDDNLALAIYSKLATKKRLGFYLKELQPKENPFSQKSRRLITERIKKESDIVDALYYSSEGRSFEEHYRIWLKKMSSNAEQVLLQQLCCLGELGISRIPWVLLREIAGQNKLRVNFSDFCKKYKDVLFFERAFVGIKRERILSKLLPPLNEEETKTAIKQTAIYTVPANENEKSERRSIFENVLKVRRIRNKSLLDPKAIPKLMNELETTCSGISYYWVQRGIASQVVGNYEDANNHLLYAQLKRPRAYQVSHALAKNNMEWGLALIRCGSEADGKTKYYSGADELRGLIYSGRYNESYRYAVHTLVDMELQLSSVLGYPIDDSICKELSELLQKLLHGPLDNVLIDGIERFIQYCENHSKNNYSDPLLTVRKRRPNFIVSKDAYEDLT